jgi:hypothetical protein
MKPGDVRRERRIPATSRSNPRALFFNDAVVVGYVRWTRMLEVAVQDPRQGVIFYTLDKTRQERPSLLVATIA